MKNPCISPMRARVPGSRQHSPTGFTLVELLVVIGIIALLAGLLTPAVMRSLSSSRAAAVKAEMDLLDTALMNYKNEYGSFPPSDMRGLWNNSGNAVNTSHPAYKHLQRIFPRLTEQTTGGMTSPYYWMAQMSPAQALVFWLQGYFDDPQYPLTNRQPLSASAPRAGTANANRKKLFDFDESRLYAASAYWPLTAPFNASNQVFATRSPTATPFERDFPVYFPNQAIAGLPYVYFSSSSYSTAPIARVTSAIGPGMSPDCFYTAVSMSGNATGIAPYFNSLNCTTNPTQQSWAQLHMNPDTFQLIAGGADGTYGSVAAGFPADCALTPITTPLQPFSYASQQVGPFFSVRNSSGGSPGHEDNIANFATGRLKEAAEKLSQ